MYILIGVFYCSEYVTILVLKGAFKTYLHIIIILIYDKYKTINH